VVQQDGVEGGPAANRREWEVVQQLIGMGWVEVLLILEME